jgi:hypothetical protein
VDDLDKQRLAALLRKNRRRKLIAPVVQAWADHGLSASVLSDERQQELLAQLRRWWTSHRYDPVTDVQATIADFVGPAAMVVVIDWDVNEQPALLVPARALHRPEKELRHIYPDGLVVMNEQAALVIDFEEQLGHVNVQRCAG